MRRDRLGLRLEPPNPATLLGDLAARLRECADGPDTTAARAVVSEALGSKWWGLRVLAIQVIGRWGTERDRAWLVERARRPRSTRAAIEGGEPSASRWREVERWEALKALFRLAPRPDDAGWLLDLWFDGPGMPIGSRWLGAVPEAALRERVAAEILSRDPARLRRAIWLIFQSDRIDNSAEILGHLTASADEAAAGLAASLLARSTPQPPPMAPRRAVRSPPPRRRPRPR